MKFDTNKTKATSCTKISAAQCYLMDNASIPSSAPGWDWPTARDNDCDDDEDKTMSCEDNAAGGRQVMYEPTVVFTPVYASMRQQSGSPGSTTEKRALLSWPNVKDVLSQLEALSLGFGSSSNSNNEGSNNDIEARKMPAKEARDDAVTTGRYLLRGNRKREASTLAGFAAPEPVASAHYTTATAAAPYQPAVRRSPRLHPEIATSMPAVEICPHSGSATKRRAAGPFGY
jgi:hypothetical protein